MNNVVEIEPQAVELDPVLGKLRESHDLIARRAKQWLALKQRYLRFVQEMVLLGCELSMDGTFDVQFRVAGDKQKFLQLVRCHRRHGFSPTMPEKGATSAFWRINRDDAEFPMWFAFTSTVCQRVKVGTRMVEQDVFETHCESIAPDDENQLPEPAPATAILPPAQDVPF